MSTSDRFKPMGGFPPVILTRATTAPLDLSARAFASTNKLNIATILSSGQNKANEAVGQDDLDILVQGRPSVFKNTPKKSQEKPQSLKKSKSQERPQSLKKPQVKPKPAKKSQSKSQGRPQSMKKTQKKK